MTDDARLLQLLLDEREIRNLLIAIARTVDEKDFEGTAALYAEDGELVTPWGGHRGRAGMAEHIRGDLGAFPGLHHVSAGHEIDVEPGADTARARMTLLATHVLDDEGTRFTTVGGHYDVDLVREDGRWRLGRVRIAPAWRFAAEGGSRGGSDPAVVSS
jgi:uncharacterized protein (TIGR02246 family)